MADRQRSGGSKSKFVSTYNAKERYCFYNTLLCLVKALEGIYTTIDLRNDSYITGKIDEVDGYMNINIENAVYCDPRGNEYGFDSLFIKHRNIRYVHVPEKMPMMQLIEEQLETIAVKPKARTGSARPTFKTKRTKARHMETVSSMKALESPAPQ